MIDRLLDVLIDALAPFLDQIWNSINFWRVLALSQVLTISLAWRFRERIISFLNNSEHQTYDRKIYLASSELFGENEFVNLMDSLETNHAFRGVHLGKFLNFIEFHSEIGNQYLNSKLRQKNETLLRSLKALNHFMAINFWVTWIGDDDRLFRMHPELNIDFKGSTSEHQAKYEKFADQLHPLIRTCNENYKDYRMAIKKELIL